MGIYPKRRADLITEEIEGDLLCLHPEGDKVLLLNETAAVVFDLCDGHHAPEKIAAEIASILSVSTDTTLADVKRILEEFETYGLLEP